MSNKKSECVCMTVDALRILEQTVQDDEEMAVGIKMGLIYIHGLLQKIAQRATELDDPILHKYMLQLHLYDVENVSGAIEQMETRIDELKKGGEL